MSYDCRSHLRNKIEWEGGIYEALWYGITADDMPDEELKEKWTKLVEIFEEFRTCYGGIEDMLDCPEDCEFCRVNCL